MQKENAHSIAVAFLSESPAIRFSAEKLAAELGLTFVPINDVNHPFLLVQTDTRLELRCTRPKSSGPISVDFSSASLRYRIKYGGGSRQTLAKAVGIKKNRRPNVFDATAGFGKDAFILANLGCQVIMGERSPILVCLLEDGIKRGLLDVEAGTILRERLRLLKGDSINIMSRMTPDQRPQVVYLDPMFPHRQKSALVKKEMQLLHELLGHDSDSSLLHETALSVAGERVVVKRPKSARPLDGPEPSFALPTPNHRFDVYLTSRY